MRQKNRYRDFLTAVHLLREKTFGRQHKLSEKLCIFVFLFPFPANFCRLGMFYLHSTPPGNQFQRKSFLGIPEKSIIFWNLIEKRFSCSSGIFSLRGQWNSFSEETWKFQKRGMFTVVEQKLLDWCYHIFFLRAREDIFVGNNLVEQYLEVICL